MVDFALKDRVALITGASRGIGEAIATMLAEYGAHCILVSRKLAGLERVASKIAAAGGTAEAVACHLGKFSDIAALFASIEQNHTKARYPGD